MTRAWHRLWRPLLGIGVLAAVLVGVDPVAIGERVSQADIRLVLLAVLGLTAMHVVPAAGWRAILATTAGLRLPWPATLSLYYASQAIGGVTPANVGGDLHRAAALRRAADPWAVAIAPLIVQRATSYLALSALSLLALAELATRTGLAGGIVVAGAAFAAAVGVAAWLLLSPPEALRAPHARLVRLVGGGAPGARISRLGAGSAIGMAYGLAFHAGSIGLTWLLVVGVDPRLPPAEVVAALTVARLSLAVPLTPSGLGVQEGVLVILFAALGLPGETALAALLLARLSLVLTAMVGAVLLMRPVGQRGAESVRNLAPKHRGRYEAATETAPDRR